MVILGLGINGLGIARALGERGLKIYGFSRKGVFEAGTFSRYVETIRYQSSSDLLDRLLEISSAEAQPVLFCSSDAFIDFVFRRSDSLADRFRYNWQQKELYRKLIDKKRYAEILHVIGVPHPETLYPARCRDLDDALRQIGRMRPPFIAKPARGGRI